MLGLDGRTARIAWTVVLIAAALAVVYLIRRTLLIFICGLLLAYLLAPVVDLLDRFTHNRLPRSLSLAIVYALLVVLVIVAAGSIGARVAVEARNMAERLPAFLDNPRIPVPSPLEPYRQMLTDWIRSQLETQAKEMMPVLQRAGQQAVSALTNLVFVVLVPILSFFFLRNPREIADALIGQFAEGPHRSMVEETLGDVHTLLAVYVRTLVLFSLITFTIYLIFLTAIGSPYAVMLALSAALLEFIPAAGPLLAAAAIIVANLFSGPGLLLVILIFLAVYRLVMDYVILPRLMGSEVQLPPLVIIFAILAGEQVGGIPGMFLSIPIFAVGRVVYLRYRRMQAPIA